MIDPKIHKELLNLTKMRQELKRQHDPVQRLFQSPSMSHDELEKAEKSVEIMVPEFHVWWESNHQRYVLVPEWAEELQ